MDARRIAVAGLVLAAFASGCAQPRDGGVEPAHVHGLAYDPDQDALLVATHGGLLRAAREDGWRLQHVGAQRYDLMGFTQDGSNPRILYAGGHPGLLGLAASTDGGATWRSRSYEGEADIHALTGVPGREGALYAWWHGMPLMASLDGGHSWERRMPLPEGVYALSASRDALFLAAPGAVLRSGDDGRTAETLAEVRLVKVAAAPDGQRLLGAMLVARSEVDVVRSLDGGRTWEAVGQSALRRVPYEASFAVDPRDPLHAFVATSGGSLFESRDGGGTWTLLRG